MSHYGSKNHINPDVGYGFIRRYAVTDASVHDSKMLGAVLDADNTDDDVWAFGAPTCLKRLQKCCLGCDLSVISMNEPIAIVIIKGLQKPVTKVLRSLFTT